jgi:hypothetical protein
VWSNCREYNHEESEIMVYCNDTQRAFEAAWQMEGLPTLAAAWQPQRAATLRAEAAALAAAMTQQERQAMMAPAAGGGAAAGGGPKAGGGSRPSSGAGKPAAAPSGGAKPAVKRKLSEGAGGGGQGPPSKRGKAFEGDWTQRAQQALAQLMRLEASEPFHEPVGALPCMPLVPQAEHWAQLLLLLHSWAPPLLC